MNTLSSVKVGTTIKIVDIDLEEIILKRLNALGIRIGKYITVVRRACLDGPIQVRAGQTDILLRLDLAKMITVVK